MSRWQIQPIWKDKEVFVIGGGASLKGFDTKLLIPELTIGCNSAYKLGADVCKVCIFGDGDDNKFWGAHKVDLSNYEGMVFTNSGRLLNSHNPWLYTIDRRAVGFHTDALGWNGNTGFAAINLALLFGASIIYLLGFDMKLVDGQHNWHDDRLDKTGEEVYVKFLKNVPFILRDWREKFFNQQIINVTKESNLECFPKVDFDAFWKSRCLRRIA